MTDPISLTRSLLRFDTVNPPGRERDCARFAGRMLEEWGYRVDYHEYEDARTSVVARAGGSDAKAPLCLTGHLDVVPLGARAWSKDPFSGETDGDRLYGRGASDMKAGVAAILLAARAFSGKLAGTPGIVVVLTAAEEGGCIGSRQLARTNLLGKAGAMIVGEPTSNYPLVGPQRLAQVPRALQRGFRARLDAAPGRERDLQGGARRRRHGEVPLRSRSAPRHGRADAQCRHHRRRQYGERGARFRGARRRYPHRSRHGSQGSARAPCRS